MYEHERLRIEQALATARRAIYRAIEAAEVAQDFGLEEDLGAVNIELARIMEGVLPSRQR